MESDFYLDQTCFFAHLVSFLEVSLYFLCSNTDYSEQQEDRHILDDSIIFSNKRSFEVTPYMDPCIPSQRIPTL